MNMKMLISRLCQKAHLFFHAKKQQKHIPNTKQTPQIVLSPLTPGIFTEDNQLYVDQIKHALQVPDIYNMALSGDYGTGKSSIVKQLVHALEPQYRIKKISCLTLHHQPKEQNLSTIIQSEVLKQLIYEEHPNTLNGTQYKRIGQFPIKNMFCISLLATLAVLFFYYELPSLLKTIPLNELLTPSSLFTNFTLQAIIFAILNIGILTAFIFAVLYMLYVSTGNISKLSISKLTIDLSDDKPDFHQMLDTIIHIVSKKRYSIFIIEDIDRYEAPQIIEELRQLCLTLNNSKQIKKKIVFIYALRDSLIPDVQKRTKIFDFIVPVAPFVSTFNSKNFIQGELSDTFKMDKISQVINVISATVSDMRTIKAICNTAKVYNAKLKQNKYLANHLIDNDILALSSIREMYPEIVNEMRNGRSIIDQIFTKCQNTWQNEYQDRQDNLLKRSTMTDNDFAKIQNSIIDSIKRKSPSRTANTISLNDTAHKLTEPALWINSQLIKKLRENPTTDIKATDAYGRNIGISVREIIQNIEELGYSPELLSHTQQEYERSLREFEPTNFFSTFALNSSFLTSEEIEKLKKSPLVADLLEKHLLSNQYRLCLAPMGSSLGHNEVQVLSFKIQSLDINTPMPLFLLSDIQVKLLFETLSGSQLGSPALYNDAIFKYLLRQKDQHQIDTILQRAPLHEKEFFSFFDGFCARNLHENEEEVILLAKKLLVNYQEKISLRIINNKMLLYDKAHGRLLREALMPLADITQAKVEPVTTQIDNFINSVLLSARSLKNIDDASKIIDFVIQNRIIIKDLFVIKEYPTLLDKVVFSESFNPSIHNFNILPQKVILQIISQPSVNADTLKNLLKTNKQHQPMQETIIERANNYIQQIDESPELAVQFARSIVQLKKYPGDSVVHLLLNKLPVEKAIDLICHLEFEHSPSIISLIQYLPAEYHGLFNDQTHTTLARNNHNEQLVEHLQKQRAVHSVQLSGDHLIITHNEERSSIPCKVSVI